MITRDPDEGEYVKYQQNDSKQSQSKTRRQLHVLFLEYNNQRAWLPSSSLTIFQGRAQFEKEAAAAPPNRKKDYTPGKKYQARFDKAVEFSESLLDLSNEDRLETVLQKYGWVMVSEPGTGDTARQGKSKKRKSVGEADPEVTKILDSETDSPGGMAAGRLDRPGSLDRRSSAEAESRLDPGLDSLDGDLGSPTSAPAPAHLDRVKKKRESSLVAAIALNGDSSDDSACEDIKSKSSTKTKTTDKTVRLKPKAKVSLAAATSAAGKTGESGDDFPRLGDLVWGRMQGFPFWPSFVTKSPQGLHKKEAPGGKTSYHVQFFNWNDESGWVNAVLEFDGLDSFKKIAGTIIFFTRNSKLKPRFFFTTCRAVIVSLSIFLNTCREKEVGQVLQSEQGGDVL